MNPFDEIYRDICRRQYQEKVIEYLSSLNFHFVNYSTLYQYTEGLEGYKNYQFMLKKTSKGFNSRMILGIKIMGDHVDHYFVFRRVKLRTGRYRYNVEKRDTPWKIGQIINMRKKKVLTQFPDVLSIQDRIDWRKMAHKVSMGRSIPPTDFLWYSKHLKKISAMNPHRTDLAEALKDLQKI